MVAIIGLRSDTHFERPTTPSPSWDLGANEIGDAGAIALSRQSEGDACDVCSSGARVTVLMASVSAHSQETFCHLSRNSVSMVFHEVLSCRCV